MRTSISHPLRFDSLAVPGLPGRIGMTICPGKQGDAIYGASWQRDMGLDLQAIRNWGASAVVSLLEEDEFALLGIGDFPAVMARQPFAWHWLEIGDGQIPDKRFEQRWPHIRPGLRQLLQDGNHILVHCRGGLGRTGLVVARFLIEEGIAPDTAIAQVREARPGAIETEEQAAYLRQQAWRPR